MIKNFVFDLGRVLVDFYPIPYLNTFHFDENTKSKLNEIIFESKDWYEYDRGIYEHNTDLIKKLSQEHPELSKEISLVLSDDWVKIHHVKQDTAEFLKNLKEQGHNIYILSNLSEDSYNFITKLDFFQFVDGGTYSYQIKICKPDAKIYQNLLEKYNLIPKETVFIDDKLENIEAANALGIHGIQFTSLEEVKDKIKALS